MDIKKWFEYGTNMEIKELAYIQPPTIPYNTFIDDKYYRGSDDRNDVVVHNVTFEHYNSKIDESKEAVIENFLNKENKKFQKNREWLNDEKLFMTIFELDTFLEKIK